MTKEIHIFYADGRGYSVKYSTTYDYGQGNKGGFSREEGFLQTDELKMKIIEKVFDQIKSFLGYLG